MSRLAGISRQAHVGDGHDGMVERERLGGCWEALIFRLEHSAGRQGCDGYVFPRNLESTCLCTQQRVDIFGSS